MNHLLLYALIKERAGSIEGCSLRSIRLLPPLLSVELGRRSKSYFLVVILSTPGPFCYMCERDPVGEIGAPAFKRIFGGTIIRAPRAPLDRLLELELETAGERVSLVVSLFGSAAKVRVVGRERIIESLDPSETGARSKPLRRRKVPLAEIDSRSLASVIHNPKEVYRQIPGLEPELAACVRQGDGAIDAERLLGFRDGFVAGTTPFSLASSGRLGRATPVPVECRGEFKQRLGPFASAADACAALGDMLAGRAHELILDRFRAPLRRYVDTRRELRDKLERDLARARAYDIGRNEADILAAFQSQIPPGATEVELPDLYAKDKKRTIKLDPSLPIAQQIRKRYKLAAKLERSMSALKRRISQLDRFIAEVDRTLKDAREADFPDAFRVLENAVVVHGRLRQDRRVQRPASAAKQYRRYDLDDQWFVLVGRNDEENDEITFRISSPEDVWMHAQQVPGSHVVLRSHGSPGNPPSSILQHAAAIAAYYSKARQSKIVPVIYTKRKYVRKFRGANPGQVRCEREKTIFVEPHVPDES